MNPTVRTRKQRGCVMQHRRRFKQNITLKDRLTAWADEVRERAKKLPPGPERNALLKESKSGRSSVSFGRLGQFAGTTAAKVSAIGHRSIARHAIVAYVRTFHLFARSGHEVPVACRQDHRPRNAN